MRWWIDHWWNNYFPKAGSFYSYLLTAALLFSSTHVGSTVNTTKKDMFPLLTEKVLSDDVEQASVDVIFKDWVKRALADLPSLLDIPQGGKKLNIMRKEENLVFKR